MDPKLKLARTIVGIIGNVISFGLFLSPMPTILRFWKNKSTEQFHPYNYASGIMNCILWVFYGSPAVHPNSTLIWTINSVGLVLYTVYTSNFWWFADKKNRNKVYYGLAAVIAATAVIVPTVLILCPTTKQRTLVEGIICVVFNIILYASPMTVLATVYKTKSVEFLPFWVSFAGFANGSCWTAYGLMPYDINLLIGNGLGAVLSLIQLVLHCIYGNPWASFKEPFVAAAKFVREKRSGETSKPEKTVQLENMV